MFNKDFKSILELTKVFSSEQKCIEHLEELYWKGKPISPFDVKSVVYKCKDNHTDAKTQVSISM